MTQHDRHKFGHLAVLYTALAIPSSMPDVEIVRFQMVEVKNQTKQIEVVAPKASIYRKDQIAALTSPEARIWGQSEQPYLVTANQGVIQTQTQDMHLQNNCSLTSPDGTVFQSENILYNRAENSLKSEDDIVALRKADKLSDSIELTGRGLIIDLNDDVFHILSNIRAQRRTADNKDLRILSEKSTIYPHRNLAYFLTNVRVYSKDMELNGDKLAVKFGDVGKSKGLDHLVLESNNEPQRKISAKLEKITLYSKAIKIMFNDKGEFSHLEADGAVDAVTKDNIKMRSESLVYKTVNGVQKVLLKDNVEIQTPEQNARCQEAEFTPETGDIILSRVATVKKGDQILRGEKIRFSVKHSKVYVEKASGEMLRNNLGF